MSVRNIPLFFIGRATPFLRAQWVQKAALQPLPATLALIDKEGMATGEFRGLWKTAFPTRQPLPNVPLSEPNGCGTLEFWDAFL